MISAIIFDFGGLLQFFSLIIHTEDMGNDVSNNKFIGFIRKIFEIFGKMVLRKI
jgi:hypothetical protein